MPGGRTRRTRSVAAPVATSASSSFGASALFEDACIGVILVARGRALPPMCRPTSVLVGGPLGAILGRTEAHVVRLALLYALVDGTSAIADEIWQAISRSTEGLTRSQIRELFERNKAKAEIDAALGALGAAGLIERSFRTSASFQPSTQATSSCSPARVRRAEWMRALPRPLGAPSPLHCERTRSPLRSCLSLVVSAPVPHAGRRSGLHPG
jgi:hypothetical protein